MVSGTFIRAGVCIRGPQRHTWVPYVRYLVSDLDRIYFCKGSLVCSVFNPWFSFPMRPRFAFLVCIGVSQQYREWHIRGGLEFL